MGAEDFADHRRAIHDPETVRAMVEDCRAGLGVDHDADRAAGRRLGCPTLVLRSSRDAMEQLYGDVLEVCRPWATQLQRRVVDSGHHMAEEAPEQLLTC